MEGPQENNPVPAEVSHYRLRSGPRPGRPDRQLESSGKGFLCKRLSYRRAAPAHGYRSGGRLSHQITRRQCLPFPGGIVGRIPWYLPADGEGEEDRVRMLNIDRERTRKPRLVGGVKGRNIIKLFLTGKPRPVGGELHITRNSENLRGIEGQFPYYSPFFFSGNLGTHTYFFT